MTTLRAIEEFTGHKKPPNPMKTIGTILLALVALAFVLAFAGCATVKTTVTAPDGTVTVTESTAPVPAAFDLAGKAIDAAAPPKARVVREEKADHDMRRLLRGWRGPVAVAATGPITPEEIAKRNRKP